MLSKIEIAHYTETFTKIFFLLVFCENIFGVNITKSISAYEI